MNVKETYLDVLKAAIWGGELTSEGVKELTNERVNDVIQLAAFQGTGPLVYDQLLKLKDIKIPDAHRMQMKQQCMISMMLQNTMMPILSKAWNALTDANINPILLKGFALAQYYHQPYLRQWGDIDIYVGQKKYHPACAVLRATFPTAECGEVEDEEDKHYNFDFPNTAIETHRVSMTFAHPRDRKYYEQLEEQCLTKNGPKVDMEGLTVTLPEETFEVFFIFLHAWHHFEGTGMNMKQVCDMAVLLHAKRDTIDRDRLDEMLSKLYLMEAWQLIMYILVQHLGLLKDEAPFYTEACKERSESLLERILAEGSSRRSKKLNLEGDSYLKRKLNTFQLRISESKEVKPYAPRYARHMLWSAIVHGIERTMHRK